MKSSDPRDYTPEPSAMLDPLWVLLMRERCRSAVGAGWPKFSASRERGNDMPDWGIVKPVDRV